MQCLNRSGRALAVQIVNKGGNKKFPGFSQNFKLSTKAFACAFGILK